MKAKPGTITADTIVKEFSTFSGSYSIRNVFSDFCELYSLALQNAMNGKNDKYAENEKWYLRTLNKYKAEEKLKFSIIAAMLVEAMEIAFRQNGEHSDILGSVWESLDMGNERLGQFFTPMDLSNLCAQMQMRGVSEMLAEKPFITIGEPCVGSGRMVLAAANVLLTEGFIPCRTMVAECWDVDILSVYMSHITFTLADIPARIIHGDSLSQKVTSVIVETFAYQRGEYRWNRPGRNTETQSAEPDLVPEKVTENIMTEIGQLVLF